MTVYIIGSGFSQAAGGPLSKEINLQLFNSETSKNSYLYHWIGKHLYYNQDSWYKNCTFEELISRLDLFLHYSHSNGRHERKTKEIELELIYQFIELLNKQNLSYNPTIYEKFIEYLQPNDTIISFNYDLLIERTLQNLGMSMPDFGLGEDINNLNRNFPFYLFKLHGSINWSYCPRCKEIYENKNVNNKSNLDASQGRCILKPLIIPPTLYKSYSIPKLRLIWKKAFKALSETNCIYFIGYSIPRADTLVFQLLDIANYLNIKKPKVYLVNGNKANYSRHLTIYSSIINTNLSFEEWVKIK